MMRVNESGVWLEVPLATNTRDAASNIVERKLLARLRMIDQPKVRSKYGKFRRSPPVL